MSYEEWLTKYREFRKVRDIQCEMSFEEMYQFSEELQKPLREEIEELAARGGVYAHDHPAGDAP